MQYVVMCKHPMMTYRRLGNTDFIYEAAESRFCWRANRILAWLQKCYPENEYWIERNKK